MPTPSDDPAGASPFAPLWSEFVRYRPASSTYAPAFERFAAWWGAPLASDLEQWLLANGDGIRPLRSVAADDDAFAWLLASRHPLDWQLAFAGLLPVTGPDVPRTQFYAVIEPPRPTTRVVRWDLGFDPDGTVALDLPSFWALSDACSSDVPSKDEDELRDVAAAMAMAEGRFARTFPWARWLHAIAGQLDEVVGTCPTPTLPDAFAPLARAQPIIDALMRERPYTGPALDLTQLDAELEAADFAASPPRALYWLWLAALTGDRPTLARLHERLRESPAKLVRDALAHAEARVAG